MLEKPSDVLYCGVDLQKIKDAQPILDPENLEHFKTYIHERYQVYVKRVLRGGDRPWTNDKIIQKFRFTNVFRENDKQTLWLIRNISENKSLSYKEKILNSILFRSWNKMETFEKLGGPFHTGQLEVPEMWREKIEKLIEEDSKYTWYTPAYNTGGLKQSFQFPDGMGYRNGYRKIADAKDKPKYEENIPIRMFYMINWVLKHGIVERVVNSKDQAQVFENLNSIHGYGPFLAYQVFVDLTYIPQFPFSENHFTVCGPGCKQGISRVCKDRDGLSFEEFLFWLRDNQYDILFSKREADKLFHTRAPEDRHLNVMALENCFCEIFKYLKVFNQEGRPRQVFVGYRDEKTLF